MRKLYFTITLLSTILLFQKGFSQSIIRVTVTSVQTSGNVDCDNALFDVTGPSDFVWEYTATDNTLGYSNNNPALFGVYDFNYTYINGNNGPYTISSPNASFVPTSGLFFDRQ